MLVGFGMELVVVAATVPMTEMETRKVHAIVLERNYRVLREIDLHALE